MKIQGSIHFIISYLPLLFLIVSCGNNETEDFGIPESGEGQNVILTSPQSETNSLEEYLRNGTNAETFMISPLQYSGYSIVARISSNTEDEAVQENANRICNKIKRNSRASGYTETQGHRTGNSGMGLDANNDFTLLHTRNNGTYFSSISCTSS